MPSHDYATYTKEEEREEISLVYLSTRSQPLEQAAPTYAFHHAQVTTCCDVHHKVWGSMYNSLEYGDGLVR